MEVLGNKEAFAKNLRRQIEMSDKTRYQICKDTGISYSTMSDWLNADTYPRFSRIKTLADYFGITTEELVGVTNTSILTEQDEEVLAGYMQLSSQDKKIVSELINRLRGE